MQPENDAMGDFRPYGLMVLLRRKVASWRRMPWVERGWFIIAYPLLGLARLAVLILPFRQIAPWLGNNHQTAAWVPLATVLQTKRATHIGRAVRLAARYTPWESKCLAQAMVARLLLGVTGLPYVLYLGVRKDGVSDLVAHAWVCVGRVAVTGGYGFRRFTVVSTFVAKGRAT